jgi:multiple sugar transport system permease protein
VPKTANQVMDVPQGAALGDSPSRRPSAGRRRSRRTKRVLNRATPYLFLLPAAVFMGVGLFYPVCQSIWLSFHDWKLGMAPASATFSGWENYLSLLRDANVYTSTGVTLTFAFTVVVLELVLGVALALLLERPVRGMSLFRTVFILPMMVAPVVVGLIWRFMYSEQFGILNKITKAIGVGGVPWLSSQEMALTSVIIADVWQWTPFIFILAMAALQSLPASAIEAARVDGANAWQTIWHVKLPLMMPVIIIATLLRLIDAFKVLEVIFIMTDGGPGLSTEILSLHIYKTAFISQQLGRASALSNLLLLIVLVLSIGLFAFSKWRESQARRIAV